LQKKREWKCFNAMLLSSLLLKLRLHKLGITGLLCLLVVSTSPLNSQAGQWDILPEADYQQPYIQDEQTGQTILLSPNRMRAETNTAETNDDTLELKRTLVKLHTEYEQVVRMNYKLKEVLERQTAQPQPWETTPNNTPNKPAISAEKMMAITNELTALKQENLQLQQQVNQFGGSASQWQTTATNQQKMVQTLQQKVDGLIQENNRLMQKMAIQTTPTKPAYAAAAIATPTNISSETKQLRETIAQLKVENETLHQQLNSGLGVGEPAQAHSKLQEATQALKQAFTTIQDQNNRIAGLKEKIESLQSLQLSNNGETNIIGLSAIESNNTTKDLLASSSELQLLQNQLKDYEQTIQQLKAQLQKQASVVMAPIAEKTSIPVSTGSKNSTSAQEKAQSAFEQGLKQEQAADWQKALSFYQQANQLQPEQPYYQLALARAFLQQEQTPASLLLLEKLRTQPSIQQEVFSLLGKAYLNQQDKTNASTAYQASFKPEALSNYAMLLKQQGGADNLKTSEALMKVAIHLHPTDANLQYNLGNLYVNTLQPKLAIDAYKQAIALNGKLSKAYYNLGLLEAEQANNDLAKQYFETYLQLEPNASNKESVQQALSSL
jgi:cytochrome c-type biogenesis protein CcmH/NrfG